MKNIKIGIIGAGNMAGALIHGMINSNKFIGSQILINNRSNASRINILKEYYGVLYQNKEDLVKASDVLILAVKPQDILLVMKEISQWVTPEKLIISIAAGVEIKSITKDLCPEVPIIRAMLNTSAKVLSSATALSLSNNVLEFHSNLALEIFSCVGTVRIVSEEQMDTVTGLSGSGPAYVYTFIDAMIDGGKELGLSDSESKELVIQTLKGAIEMVCSTGSNPADLSRQICSPNGTTIAGLEVLTKNNFRQNIIDAISAAAQRSKELRR